MTLMIDAICSPVRWMWKIWKTSGDLMEISADHHVLITLRETMSGLLSLATSFLLKYPIKLKK